MAAACKQFAFMVKYGMTPMQAIQAATTNAADLLGHSNECRVHQAGQVCRRDRGRRAIRSATSAVLEQVQFVMKDGKVYKQ